MTTELEQAAADWADAVLIEHGAIHAAHIAEVTVLQACRARHRAYLVELAARDAHATADALRNQASATTTLAYERLCIARGELDAPEPPPTLPKPWEPDNLF